MNKRTFSYVSGRFRDYYRSEEIQLPPEAEAREWGYIPFNEDGDVFMVRHKSLGALGGIDEFTKQEAPQHFYFSCSKYDEPGIQEMNSKGWNSADLIFDIDADHLSNVDEHATSYDEMLAEGKRMLQKLLTVLQNEFGFEDLEVVFSGGRGYHVHVRDDSVQELTRSARNEIVDYLTATNIDFEHITTEYPFGIPLQHSSGRFPQSSGWGKKYADYMRTVFDDLRDDILEIYEEKPDEEAVSEVTALLKENYDISNIGTERTKMVIEVFKDEERYAEARLGNVEVAPAVKIIAKQILEQAQEDLHVEIDEPVTTDTNRLIRLPGSLHGGSGLRVTRIDFEDIESFTPLEDAIPETFTGNTVQLEVTEDEVESYVGGEKTVYTEGEHEVPEYEAVHLICQGEAKKLAE